MSVLPLYRNQSINLHSKLVDWFLYGGNAGIWWVNTRKNFDLKTACYCKYDTWNRIIDATILLTSVSVVSFLKYPVRALSCNNSSKLIQTIFATYFLWMRFFMQDLSLTWAHNYAAVLGDMYRRGNSKCWHGNRYTSPANYSGRIW